jgi:hypothetical protein
MKLKDASKAGTATQKLQQKGSTIIKQQPAAISNDVIDKHDTNNKAKGAKLLQEQPQQANQLGREQQAGSLGMQPDPLLLVALHVSCVIGTFCVCHSCCGAWTGVTGQSQELANVPMWP